MKLITCGVKHIKVIDLHIHEFLCIYIAANAVRVALFHKPNLNAMLMILGISQYPKIPKLQLYSPCCLGWETAKLPFDLVKLSLVYQIRRRLHTVPFNAECDAGKLVNIVSFLVFV